MRIPHPIRCALAGALCAALHAAPLEAARTSDVYPELAARRDTLAPIVLLVDAVAFMDVGGAVEELRLARSTAIARAGCEQFHAMLEAHGLCVDTARIASIGHTLEDERECCVAAAEDSAALAEWREPRRPPFTLDSTLAADREAAAAWGRLVDALADYKRKKGQPGATLEEAVTVGRALGAPVLAVVTLESHGIPAKKGLGQSLLTGLLSGGTVTARQVSHTYCVFAILDARTGEVLWRDTAGTQSFMRPADVTGMTRFLATSMP